VSNHVILNAMQADSTIKDAASVVVSHFGGHLSLAKALGYEDLRNVSYWARGDRPFPPQHCVSIEQITKGEIMRWDLRPDDWHRIWPELRKRKDAPAIKAEA
jgi:DNA-binding transcriptional regulator YdaS (Cro superfamily)